MTDLWGPRVHQYTWGRQQAGQPGSLQPSPWEPPVCTPPFASLCPMAVFNQPIPHSLSTSQVLPACRVLST